MAGMNVEGDDARDYPQRVVELLRPTPIKWLRVHPLPTRSLGEKGTNGLTYLDGIEYLCRNGYGIVIPLDVGYAQNVGTVPFKGLDSFVEESYQFSFTAAKQIGEVARKNHAGLVFGVENEFDAKSWLLQSIPLFGWRGEFLTWAKLALDYDLKYRRLNNILRGARDAEPGATTMANVVAVDANPFVEQVKAEARRHSDLLRANSILVEDLTDNVLDWRTELKYLKDHLDVDLVGLDTYANYLLKYPVLGLETGGQLSEAAALTGKPVFNPEFGYSTYRSVLEKIVFGLLRRPSAATMQRQYFRNTLDSIGQSQSRGTFPWVLMTHTDRSASPEQEAYYGLFQIKGEKEPRKMPAYDYYAEWLRKKKK